MNTLARVLAVSVVLFAFVGVVSISELTAQQKTELCIVYDIGGRGDLSFNDMAALGGDNAVKAGLATTLVEVQSKSEQDYLPNLRNLARRGTCTVIVGIGFLLTDAVVAVATEFPNQNFGIIDGFIPNKSNVLSVLFKEQEGSALIGALGAVLATENKSSSVGVVLGIEIPVLWKFECGYRFGVNWGLTQRLKTNKDAVKVLFNYTGSFGDPAKGKAATEIMLNQGAIMVYNVAGATGLGIFEAVEARAKAAGRTQGPPFAIGVDADQDYIKPGFILASMMKRVDQGVFTAAKQAKEGTFKGGILELGLNEGGIALSRVEDLETFLQIGINAGTVKASDKESIIQKVKAMRDSVPKSVFEAAAELEKQIRSGATKIPLAQDKNAIEDCRKNF
jgi:basic membrane protein A